jgi:hypothetical protein
MPATQVSPEAKTFRWPTGLASAIALLLIALWAAPVAPAAVAIPALDTTITAGPDEGELIEDERPSFSFEATLASAPFPGATFRCSLDNGPAESCTSPFLTPPLEGGAHSFSVFAEGAEHFVADPTPAQRTFSVSGFEEDCEVFEDEEESGEEVAECEEEEAEDSRVPPEECLLRTARARLFTYSSQNRVRLVIRYTAFAPADVYVDYKLSGGKGSLKLGTAHQRFAKSGLLRVNERLTDGEMDKVRAAKRFTVLMTVPEAPRFCRRYDTRHLTIRRTVHSQAVWFQSDSIFGS